MTSKIVVASAVTLLLFGLIMVWLDEELRAGILVCLTFVGAIFGFGIMWHWALS